MRMNAPALSLRGLLKDVVIDPAGRLRAKMSFY